LLLFAVRSEVGVTLDAEDLTTMEADEPGAGA
jgi:hypothetical protein